MPGGSSIYTQQYIPMMSAVLFRPAGIKKEEQSEKLGKNES